MNESHPPGGPFPADTASDFPYAAPGPSYEQSAHATYGGQDPQDGYGLAYDSYPPGAFDNPSGVYDFSEVYAPAGPYPGADGAVGYPAGTDGAIGAPADGTGQFNTGAAWADSGQTGYSAFGIPAQGGPVHGGYDHPADGPATGGYAGGDYGWDTTGSGSFGVDAYGTGQFDTTGFDTNSFEAGDFDNGQFGTGQLGAGGFDHGGVDNGAYSAGFDNGGVAAGDTGAFAGVQHSPDPYGTGSFDPYPAGATAFPTGPVDNGGFHDAGYHPGDHDAAFSADDHHTGQWDSSAWDSAASWDTASWDTAAWDAWPTGTEPTAYDGYDAGYDPAAPHGTFREPAGGYEAGRPGEYDTYGTYGDSETTAAMAAVDATSELPMTAPGHPTPDPADEAVGPPVALPQQPRGGGRRRSPKARRSALLTVAVPSVAVLGVAGAAAASVAGTASSDSEEDTSTEAASGTSGTSSKAAPVKPSKANKKLDTQLEKLSSADDFADRANRTQERIDLKERQEAEKKRKEKEAARKEAMRPKFQLPVDEHGLSATFGSAGLNWMSLHSGIDFPVSEGTPVKAATDGTVKTQFDPSFGNMAKVTAKDGTETWYCHLSSTKIRSGEVKAGDVIGYSGTTGNSTGPHLHFEVHPDGGDAIDPLPWLRDKGLNPE